MNVSQMLNSKYFYAIFVAVGLAVVISFVSGRNSADLELTNQPSQFACDKDNFLVNGSFEILDDTVGLVNGYRLDQVMFGEITWDVYDTLPGEGGEGTSWRTTDGSGIEIQYDYTADPGINGDYVAELDSAENTQNGSDTNTTMQQQISLPVDITFGNFNLSFNYRARTDIPDDNRIDALLDDRVVHTQNNNNQEWQTVTVGLGELYAGEHTIGFAAGGPQNTLGGLLDNVVLSCSE